MTEHQHIRHAKRRLAILHHAEEVTGNVKAAQERSPPDRAPVSIRHIREW